jgi:hypothetical protein
MHSLMNQFRFLRVGGHDDVLPGVYSLLAVVCEQIEVIITCPRPLSCLGLSSERWVARRGIIISFSER